VASPKQDLLSREVLRATLRQRIDNYGFQEYEMPVNQMDGPHLSLADLPLAVPFDSVKQYEDYISRLHQIPRVFAQTEEVLRQGLKDQLMPVRFLLEKVPAQCQGVISGESLFAADQEISRKHSAGGAAAFDQSDHGCASPTR
jgi:uncharacterized protein (DUF885 family)